MDALAQTSPAGNADNLTAVLAFLSQLIEAAGKGSAAEPEDWPRLGFFDDGSPFGQFITKYDPSFDEYALLALALVPHIRPEFLEDALRAQMPKSGEFPQIGGWREPESRILVATGQTAAYLLAGQDLDARFTLQRILSPDHWFAKERILKIEPPAPGAPRLSGRLTMMSDWADRLTLGRVLPPAFSADFPASPLVTDLAWDDLVVPEKTSAGLNHIRSWVTHRDALRDGWFEPGRFPTGCRALFFGPPGTGKTLAAALLGQATGCPVYRVDLSMVVSKYIGETEKNLAKVFEAAERRNWILFFDEADALFGKRTQVKESHDRYANQEISYLLQRIEEFDALCILASNLRGNIDDAFLRRFSAIVPFEEPTSADRQRIWRRAAPAKVLSDELIDQVNGYELMGGAIVSAVHFAAIQAIQAGRAQISLADLELGIRKEMEKEGKVFRSLNT